MSKVLTPGFRAALNSDGAIEMMVYDEIGENWYGEGISAKSVRAQLDNAGAYSKIMMRINSPGGDAFEAIAIKNLLASTKKPVEVYIDGVAASAASILAMAGDTITMGRGSMMMIHKAWTMQVGNADDMRKMADTLDKVDAGSIAQGYMDRTGKSQDEIMGMMAEETWMDAEECVKQGFATAVADLPESQKALAMARGFKAMARFAKRPESLRNEAKTKRVDGEDLTWNDFIVATDHEDMSTWHLPWKFSTVEKTKSHLRDALARFDQVQGLSKEEKHAAYAKLVRLCKKYGIEVSADDTARYKLWAKVKADADGDNDGDAPCGCTCPACVDGDCSDCSNEDCDDPDCIDCPMQKENEEETVASAESDLSLYEARIGLLGKTRS